LATLLRPELTWRTNTIPTDSEAAKASIENWKALREAEWDRSRQMVEVIVQGALVPLLTLLIGYIFCSQTAQAQQ
jgi:hypothetical protein